MPSPFDIKFQSLSVYTRSNTHSRSFVRGNRKQNKMGTWPSKGAKLSRKKHKGKGVRRKGKEKRVNTNNDTPVASGGALKQPPSYGNGSQTSRVKGLQLDSGASQSLSGGDEIYVMSGALPDPQSGENASQISSDYRTPASSGAAVQPPASGANPESGVASDNSNSQSGSGVIDNTSSGSRTRKKKYPQDVTVCGRDFTEHRAKSSVKWPDKGTTYTYLKLRKHAPKAPNDNGEDIRSQDGSSHGTKKVAAPRVSDVEQRVPSEAGSQQSNSSGNEPGFINHHEDGASQEQGTSSLSDPQAIDSSRNSIAHNDDQPSGSVGREPQVDHPIQNNASRNKEPQSEHPPNDDQPNEAPQPVGATKQKGMQGIDAKGGTIEGSLNLRGGGGEVAKRKRKSRESDEAIRCQKGDRNQNLTGGS